MPEIATSDPGDAPIRVLDARVVVGAGGGPEKTIFRTPRHLNRRRVAMTAAYLHPPDDAGAEVLRNAAARFQCPIRLVSDRGPFDWRVANELLAICRELDINVWHGHDYKTNLLGLYLRRHHPMTLVTTAHGWVHYTWRTRMYYLLEKRVLRHYDHVIAVSDDLARECIRHGVSPQRLTVTPNGIDCQEFQRRRSREDARAEFGIGEHEQAIGFVGRLSAEKRVDAAIGLLARLGRDNPALSLHIVGVGPHRETLEELARYLRVQDRVFFHGWSADARRFYEAFDLFLLPSRREGTPNVALEAMAMGVPVAATDVGGVADLLDGGRCGLVLDPEAPERWDEPVATLLNDPLRRALLVELARQRVAERYDFAKRTDTIADIYERLLPQQADAISVPAMKIAA